MPLIMSPQLIQERLSYAYVTAIVARAGYLLAPPAAGEAGIDGCIHALKYKNGEPHQTADNVALQIKSTTNYSFRGNQVVYKMEAKAYNKIARDPEDSEEKPTILLLYCMPKDPELWMSFDEESLILRQCCYWHYEQNFGSLNRRSRTIEVPKTNIFNIPAVEHLYSEYRKYKP